MGTRCGYLHFFSLTLVLLVFVQSGQQGVQAKPYSRVKRWSDQRLAELETIAGLSKMKGKLVSVPLAAGLLDPKKIGRKRRSDRRLLDALFGNRRNASPLFDTPEAAEPPEDEYEETLLYR